MNTIDPNEEDRSTAPTSGDDDFDAILSRYWQSIKSKRRGMRVQELVNVRLINDQTAEEIDLADSAAGNMLRLSWRQMTTRVKINCSFGMVLEHKTTKEQKYYHSSSNNATYERNPTLVKTEQGLVNYISRIVQSDVSELQIIMVNYCVAGGCKSTVVAQAGNFNDLVALHKFPDAQKEPGRYSAWVAFVQTHRSDFTATKNSHLCSKHFVEDDYTNWFECQFQHSAGNRIKLTLNNNALPTRSILKRSQESATSGASAAGVKRRHREEARLSHQYVKDALVEAELLDFIAEEESEKCSYEKELEEMVLDDMENDPEYQLPYDDVDDADWSEEELNVYKSYDTMEGMGKQLCFGDILKETKIIVSASKIVRNLQYCRNCHNTEEESILIRKTAQGAIVHFYLVCIKCNHKWSWDSMGNSREDARIRNALLQSSILYTGSQPSRILAFMETNSIVFPKSSLYFTNQQKVFIPVIHEAWGAEQSDVIGNIKERGSCHLGGDARCDSMGFCAQFGTYSLMDLQSNKLVVVEPVCRVETSNNSNAMEMEGLLRGLKRLQEELTVKVDSLVTDRHLQIAAIKHYFDCWHVCKSINKALRKIANHRESLDLKVERINSITNRLYYMAAHTPPGPEYKHVMNEKRVALLNHIVGVHDHEENTKYRKCHHKQVSSERMDVDGIAYQKVKAYLSTKSMQQAIEQLSPVGQTSRLESFHHVILRFAPKNLCFGYQAMTARTLLAALHYNENCNRPVILGEDGQEKFRVSYAKYKHGAGRVSKVRPPPTTNYVGDLMERTLRCFQDPNHRLPVLDEAPPTMTECLSNREPPADVESRHRSRFSFT